MRTLILSLILVLTLPAVAQQVEIKDDPQPSRPSTGQERAREYMGDRKRSDSYRTASDMGSLGAPRFMAIHIGSFFSDQAYKWGNSSQDNIAKLNAGVDYRLGEWVNSMDLTMRIDYANFSLAEGEARKLSIGANVTFPDANSRFPLYFGGGLGAGFFIKQIPNESPLALDYSIFGGVRFLDVFENVGLMVESGLKNHLHLLSDGQFNGAYINVGSVFAF